MSFDALKAAERARVEVDVPWDDIRAARGHKGVMAAFKAAREEEAVREHVVGELSEESSPDELAADPIDAAMLSKPRSLVRRMATLVALVAVAAAIAFFVRMRGDDQDFVASTLRYRDGSRSLMSAQAQVHVLSDTESHVAVQQQAGRVRYDIMPRPERDFVVTVGGVTITVLGTVFDVSIVGDQVEVVVLRGRVRVETDGRKLELTTGEHATVMATIQPEQALLESPAMPTSTSVSSVDEDPAKMDLSSEATVIDAADDNAPKAAPARSTERDSRPTATEWLRRADAARTSGNSEAALRALRSLIAAYPTDGRVTLALFTMGQVEQKRGRFAAAARAFEQCGSALKGDAIAAAAGAWQAAGQSARANAAARRYLQTFPKGVHSESMRQLAGD